MIIPLVMTKTGPIPTSPEALRTALMTIATAAAPGLTANLPGTLIEDIASTDVGALTVNDQIRIDVINSVTPFGANAFILNQLGQIYGVQQGLGVNTSVNVVFSSASTGYVIPKGTLVSDGSNQYITQEATVINAGGTSAAVYAVASTTGSWAVPANSVTTILSTVPSPIVLAVTNPSAGTPATSDQTIDDYRAQVLAAGLIQCAGLPNAIKNALIGVPGVSQNHISIIQSPFPGNEVLWEVIVSGGDPYAVANAIFNTCGDPGILTGSTLSISNITNANPGVVTTNYLHQYTTGDTVTLHGVLGMTAVNGAHTVTVTSQYTFSIGVDTSAMPAYGGGGYCTPNNRNTTISLVNTPNTYNITFVTPPLQTVAIQVTWQTTLATPIDAATIAQLASQNIIDYINAIYPGGYINYYEIQNIFQTSVASVVPIDTLVQITIQVHINGILVTPSGSTEVVVGDPEGIYYMTLANMSYVKV